MQDTGHPGLACLLRLYALVQVFCLVIGWRRGTTVKGAINIKLKLVLPSVSSEETISFVLLLHLAVPCYLRIAPLVGAD